MTFVKKHLYTALSSLVIRPLAQEFSGLLDSKLGLLDCKLESLRSDVSGQLTKFGVELSSVRKDVARLATQQGHLFEIAAEDGLQGQFAGAGPPRNLRRAEDVAAVLTLEGDPLLPTAMLLAYALHFKVWLDARALKTVVFAQRAAVEQRRACRSLV